ncbi:MAG: hypothetical protein WC812_03540 [Candidatus Pacearchaeota archaeon]|jgi:hypothetical protein
MTNNLAVIVKFENPSDIYASEMYSVCLNQLKEFKLKFELEKPFNIIKINSSMPEKWCELCTPSKYN